MASHQKVIDHAVAPAAGAVAAVAEATIGAPFDALALPWTSIAIGVLIAAAGAMVKSLYRSAANPESLRPLVVVVDSCIGAFAGLLAMLAAGAVNSYSDYHINVWGALALAALFGWLGKTGLDALGSWTLRRVER